MPMRLFLGACALMLSGQLFASADAQKIDACARGKVEACFELLARPRLDPGRRAAIELHLAELEKRIVGCSKGDAVACATLEREQPDLSPDLRARAVRPSPAER